MAIYTENYVVDGEWQSQLALSEIPLYGSRRVGIVKTTDVETREISLTSEGDNIFVSTDGTLTTPTLVTDYISRTLGNKMYELSNHLGKVFSTVSDRKLAYNASPVYFNADVLSYSDYYPFGMPLPGRQNNGGDYRYGFQNQETDPEMLSGAVAFKYRVHDARIGRFLSVDPLATKYPFNSPYSFTENSVIRFVDLEGLEQGDYFVQEFVNDNGKTELKVESVDNGESAPNRLFVLDPSADENTPNRYEYNGQFYRQELISVNSGFYTESDYEWGFALAEFRIIDPQVNIDAVAYNNSEYTDNSMFERVVETMDDRGIGAEEIMFSILSRGKIRPEQSGVKRNKQQKNEARRGKKASDSSKNQKHGKQGDALKKAQAQIDDLKKQLEGASGKTKKLIRQRIKNITEVARKADKGTEDTNTGKRK